MENLITTYITSIYFKNIALPLLNREYKRIKLGKYDIYISVAAEELKHNHRSFKIYYGRGNTGLVFGD